MRRLAGKVLSHLRRAVAAYMVLVIALSLTGLAWYYVNETVEQHLIAGRPVERLLMPE